MSTDCCDFDICNRGRDCPAGSVVAEKLLAGVELPELQPLYNLHTENSDGSDPEANEPRLTGRRVLVGALAALTCVTGIAVVVLYFFRG